MKKYILITILLFTALLLQNSFFVEFLGPVLNINFVIILAFSYIFNKELSNALFCFFVGGLFLDLLGNSIVGISSFVFVLFLLGTNAFFRSFSKSITTQILFVNLLSIFYKFIIYFKDFEFNFLLIIHGFMNTFIALVIYYFLRKASTKYKSDAYRIRA